MLTKVDELQFDSDPIKRPKADDAGKCHRHILGSPRFVVLDSAPNVVIRECKDGPEHRAARCTSVAVSALSDDDGDDDEAKASAGWKKTNRRRSEHRLGNPNEEAMILAAIRASPDEGNAFNAIVHQLAPLLEVVTRVSERNKTSLGSWLGNCCYCRAHTATAQHTTMVRVMIQPLYMYIPRFPTFTL